MWPLRTMLFIPAHKLDWVRKVDRFAPDSVVIDLEDAVPRALKAEARGMAHEAIGILRDKGIPAFVRINAFPDGGREDVPAIAREGLSGIMLPKAGSADEVRELDRLLAHGEGAAGLPLGTVCIMPLPETAQGMWAARDLAAASDRCRGLIGVCQGPISGDVAMAAGFLPTMEGREQIYLASKMVLDSRAGGAPWPMASIIGTEIGDHDGVRMLTERARGYGFTGAVLIHPDHVAIADAVFAPSEADVEYFAGLIEAMRAAEARGDAAVTYRGRMVDYAMIPMAETVLREAERRKARQAARR